MINFDTISHCDLEYDIGKPPSKYKTMCMKYSLKYLTIGHKQHKALL
jgi:hypothetical protein